jgi:hypothetical protein
MYLGLSTSNHSLKSNSLVQEFDGIFDTFLGVSEATSVAILVGLQWPMKKIEQYKYKYEQMVNTITAHTQKPQFTSLQGLSPVVQPNMPKTSNPRDILLGLLQ